MIKTQQEAEKFAALHPQKEGVMLVTSDHAIWFVDEKEVKVIQQYADERKLTMFRIEPKEEKKEAKQPKK